MDTDRIFAPETAPACDPAVAFIVAQLDEISVRRLCRRARVADNGFVESPRHALERAFRHDVDGLLEALYSPELVRVLEALELELPGVGRGHLARLDALSRDDLQTLARRLL